MWTVGDCGGSNSSLPSLADLAQRRGSTTNPNCASGENWGSAMAQQTCLSSENWGGKVP